MTLDIFSTKGEGADYSWLERQGIKLTEDGVPSRMPKENVLKPESDYLPQFDNEMWFLPVLDEREQVAIQLAYAYGEMGQPGLPDHLYLKVIHKLSELLRQVNVELETDGND